jgi:hypothetical protein
MEALVNAGHKRGADKLRIKLTSWGYQREEKGTEICKICQQKSQKLSLCNTYGSWSPTQWPGTEIWLDFMLPQDANHIFGSLKIFFPCWSAKPCLVSSIFPFLVRIPYSLRRNAYTKIFVDFIGDQLSRPASQMSNREHSCCFPLVEAGYVSTAEYSAESAHGRMVGFRRRTGKSRRGSGHNYEIKGIIAMRNKMEIWSSFVL